MTAFLAGCAAKPRGSFCDTAFPIRPTKEAVQFMSDQTKREILSHNEYGERVCGWKP